jgi:hypothetical protein
VGVSPILGVGIFENGLLDVVGRVGTVVGMVNSFDMLN